VAREWLERVEIETGPFSPDSWVHVVRADEADPVILPGSWIVKADPDGRRSLVQAPDHGGEASAQAVGVVVGRYVEVG